MNQITLSSVLALLPELGLLILMVAVLIYDRVLSETERRRAGLLTAWGTLVILLATVSLWLFRGEPTGGDVLIWGGMIRNDMVTLVFRVMFLIALIATSLIAVDVERLQRGEFFALLIAASIGFSLMAASADLIMLYVALETASISLYILAGYATSSMRSSEAGMKYFVYGAFASAIMLYGMSLIYGLTNESNLYTIAATIGQQPAETLLLATVMVVAGFAFKISAVPFHFWTPDVYEGAPTPVTALVSTASKAAGFAVFLRVFLAGTVGAPDPSREWWAMLVAMSIVTMTLGNFLAIYQTNMKRMLAYSSIAQAGYTMIGLVTLTVDGSGASMFYLLYYVFTNMAAFGVVILVSNVTGSDDMKDFYGLNRRSPYLALAMLFALLSLGGIPPTAGFFGKFFIFKAAVDAGLWWLAMLGILNAFVALYYYLSVVKYLYLYRSDNENVPIPVSRAAQVALVLTIFAVLYLGIAAGPAFEWTQRAAAAFFTG
jgi:NADH-quinone oxidoreductase subunit N